MTKFSLWIIRMVLPVVVLSSGMLNADVMIDDFEAGSNRLGLPQRSSHGRCF